MEIIDVNGVPQDIEDYQHKVTPSADIQELIWNHVQEKERDLNACQPQNTDDPDYLYYPDELQKLVENFLGVFAYTHNLLDRPYVINQQSRDQMSYYYEAWGSIGRCGFHDTSLPMYYVEKLVRAGHPVSLSDRDIEAITRCEAALWEKGNIGYLIKFLGRHKTLGLPPPDHEIQDRIQRDINVKGGDFFLGQWVICSALRAGFTIPFISAERVNARLAYCDLTSTNISKYVNNLHHLNRLFGNDR